MQRRVTSNLLFGAAIGCAALLQAFVSPAEFELAGDLQRGGGHAS